MVEAGVLGEFGMEGGHQEMTLAQSHGRPVGKGTNHLNVWAEASGGRGADEDGVERFFPKEREV